MIIFFYLFFSLLIFTVFSNPSSSEINSNSDLFENTLYICRILGFYLLREKLEQNLATKIRKGKYGNRTIFKDLIVAGKYDLNECFAEFLDGKPTYMIMISIYYSAIYNSHMKWRLDIKL